MDMDYDKIGEMKKQFPKIFSEPGVGSVGDGWYNILYVLCAAIQNHVDFKERNYKLTKARYNAVKKRNWNAKAFKYAWDLDVIKKDPETWLAKTEKELQDIPVQVKAHQIKEKFGTLRFYYSGGDEFVSGLVHMAETLSGQTCEACGKPGKPRGGGWIKTLCDEHAEERTR